MVATGQSLGKSHFMSLENLKALVLSSHSFMKALFPGILSRVSIHMK